VAPPRPHRQFKGADRHVITTVLRRPAFGCTDHAMLPALIEFIHRLREVAIPVSMVESLDAMEALKHIDLSNREQFRAALAASLVTRAAHRRASAALSDVHF